MDPGPLVVPLEMYIGIDIGTTATKAILIDGEQKLLASATAAYEVASLVPGYAEQDPSQWISVFKNVLKQLNALSPTYYKAVRRIGFSGQMHSLVALDEKFRPIRPALLWNDGRGREQCKQITSLIPHVENLTGAVAMPSFTAAKLLWLKQNETQNFAALRHIVLPKDFVRHWLCGEVATDHSDAAGTQLYDQASRQWSDDMLGLVGLATSALPIIRESHESIGKLQKHVADELGLSPDVVVCTGGGDTPVGSIGMGCVSPGDSIVSLGTSGHLSIVTDGYQPTTGGCLHNFAHAAPRQWFRMGALLNGASCLAWAASLVGVEDIGALLQQVEARFKGPSRVLFLPYLSGERTPHNNTDLRGALLGLDGATDKYDIAQAVLEGVAFSLADARDAMKLNVATTVPHFIGGGARSSLWSVIIASVLNMKLATHRDADFGPSLGAARLAMLGEAGADRSDILTKPEIKSIVEPRSDLVDAYAEKHVRYRRAFAGVAEYAEENAG